MNQIYLLLSFFSLLLGLPWLFVRYYSIFEEFSIHAQHNWIRGDCKGCFNPRIALLIHQLNIWWQGYRNKIIISTKSTENWKKEKNCTKLTSRFKNQDDRSVLFIRSQNFSFFSTQISIYTHGKRKFQGSFFARSDFQEKSLEQSCGFIRKILAVLLVHFIFSKILNIFRVLRYFAIIFILWTHKNKLRTNSWKISRKMEKSGKLSENNERITKNRDKSLIRSRGKLHGVDTTRAEILCIERFVFEILQKTRVCYW